MSDNNEYITKDELEKYEWAAFYVGVVLGVLAGCLISGLIVGYLAYGNGAVDYFKGEIECSQVYTEVVCINSNGSVL